MKSHRVIFGAAMLAMSAAPALLLAQATPSGPPAQPAAAPGSGAAGFVLPPPQVITDVPEFRYRHLALVDLPKPTGPAKALFNGRNLDGFEPWLGYALPLTYFSHGDAKPIGRQGIGDVFKVVDVDGRPAIYIGGNPQGALITPDLSNYHLRLSFKWGKSGGAPGASGPKAHNSGVLYDSYGELGGFLGTWMYSIECEVQPTNTAMMIPVSATLQLTTELGKDGDGNYRYMPGGKSTVVKMPTFVHNPRDEENTEGEWNRIDLYVVGNQSVHVLNGIPVQSFKDISLTDAAGVAHPLTHGRIQLQSELGEVYFRDITVEPIRSLPRVVVVE